MIGLGTALLMASLSMTPAVALAAPPAEDSPDEGTRAAADTTTPPTPAPAPLPDWSPYIGQGLRFVFTDGTSFSGTLTRDDGDTVLVQGRDGGLYSVDKRQVAGLEYLPAPVPAPFPAPAPAPTPPPAAAEAEYQQAVEFKEAVKYELSRGESSAEYKRARGMLVGGAVLTGVGSLLTLSGFTAAATGDLVGSAGVSPSDTQPVSVTGFALLGAGVLTLGAGIPLLVIGKKRKDEVTQRVKRALSVAPTWSTTGGGARFGLSF